MIRLRFLSVPALAATMLFVAFAHEVRADDPPASSVVSSLTEEERGFIHRRLPNFDERTEAEREKIAINVKKLFALPAEARAKFLERLQRANAAGPGAQAVVARLPGLQSAGSGVVIDGFRKMRAISSAIVATLSPSARDLVTEGATTLSISSSERRVLNVAIASAWRRKALDALVASPPTDAEPDARSQRAAEFIARRDAVKTAGGPSAPELDRRRFAEAVFEDRVGTVRRSVERAAAETGATVGPERSADAHIESLGRALADAFPVAASAVAAALSAAAEQGRAGLDKFVHDALPNRVTQRDQGLFQLVFGLERARPFVRGDMLVKVVDLELSVMRELQLPDAELVPFRVEAVTDADEALRNMILRRLMRRLAAADAGPHAGLFPRIERARDRHK